jgi:hypothetical protein
MTWDVNREARDPLLHHQIVKVKLVKADNNKTRDNRETAAVARKDNKVIPVAIAAIPAAARDKEAVLAIHPALHQGIWILMKHLKEAVIKLAIQVVEAPAREIVKTKMNNLIRMDGLIELTGLTTGRFFYLGITTGIINSNQFLPAVSFVKRPFLKR